MHHANYTRLGRRELTVLARLVEYGALALAGALWDGTGPVTNHYRAIRRLEARGLVTSDVCRNGKLVGLLAAGRTAAQCYGLTPESRGQAVCRLPRGLSYAADGWRLA